MTHVTLTLVKVRRRPPWPWWAVALVVGWMALGGATIYVSRQRGQPLTLCLFKRVTGLPCPSCGTTRAAEHLARGHVAQAVATQPFMVGAGVLFVLMTLLRVGFSRRLQMETSRRARRAVGALIAVAFVVNWVYVILYVG